MSGLDWTFFRAFVKSPNIVASAIPSSAMLERRTIRHMELETAEVIVEFGAGTGGLTRAILNSMRPDARLISIEFTAEFIPILRRIDDPRFEIIQGCASTVAERLAERHLAGADAIVSGIPFSTLPPDLCHTIAANLHAALNPGGRFVAYQFSDKVADFLSPHMGPPAVERELINIPPMRVYCWRKAEVAEEHNNVAVNA